MASVSRQSRKGAPMHERAINGDAFGPKGGGEDAPAPVLGAYPLADGNAYVLEDRLVEPVLVQQVDQRPHLHAGGVHRHDKDGDTGMLGVVAGGPRRQPAVLARLGAAGEDLAAI